nr:MAG TPA_asm: hypothetical protein [Caudoviricetes sp.]
MIYHTFYLTFNNRLSIIYIKYNLVVMEWVNL